MNRSIHILWGCLLVGSTLLAQPGDTLTLDEAVFLARNKSLLAARATRDWTQARWSYYGFRAGLKPELMLSGMLPNYTQSFQEVVQPDGRISFQPVQEGNSLLSAEVRQSVLPTGGDLFVQTNLQRYDDLVNDAVQYNGLPVRVGFRQSLTGFNGLKWDRKLADLTYSVSERTFARDMEQVALETVAFFFDVLIAQTNLQIASTNLENNERLYRIAEERLKRGKISREDFLQLKLEWVNAQKDRQDAAQQMLAASAGLRSWLVLGEVQRPLYVKHPEADATKDPVVYEKAIGYAFAHRPEPMSFERMQTEAFRTLREAKTENRFSAQLEASLGLSGSADTPEQLYQNAQEEQSLRLTFAVPLVDWGRRKSNIRVAEAEQAFVQTFVENQSQQLESEVVAVVSNYNNRLNTIRWVEEAQDLALERFRISTERFVLGDISAMDYSLSQRSKDDMQRTYARALRDYWLAHYALRQATLFDFDTDHPIHYDID